MDQFRIQHQNPWTEPLFLHYRTPSQNRTNNTFIEFVILFDRCGLTKWVKETDKARGNHGIQW